ncbi:DUF2236 domain-containing protein [Dyella sp. M7H15-1]|nr:DUF2236 domain-containing protein [Dyella sp. M7H15-1]
MVGNHCQAASDGTRGCPDCRRTEVRQGVKHHRNVDARPLQRIRRLAGCFSRIWYAGHEGYGRRQDADAIVHEVRRSHRHVERRKAATCRIDAAANEQGRGIAWRSH